MSGGRIARRFNALAEQGRRALIPYIVAGDPFRDSTPALMHRLAAAGADVLELGVPFSDPMAEGPVIQRAHERALAKGIRLRDALDMVAEFRGKDADTPVLLMGYANPVEAMGYGAAAAAGRAAGLDGWLTVDLPPEEAEGFNRELRQAGIDAIYLAAPTTPAPRLQRIADAATGFIYYVSFRGVTGAAHLDTGEVAARLAELRRCTRLPVAVGFGIKDAESAAAVAAVADGVVVGSALVSLLAERAAAGGDAESVMEAAAKFTAELSRAVAKGRSLQSPPVGSSAPPQGGSNRSGRPKQ